MRPPNCTPSTPNTTSVIGEQVARAQRPRIRTTRSPEKMVVAAAGAFHAEHLGSGDLVTVQTLASDNTQQGFIAEWDANDSDAQYQGTFMGWLDSNHSYQNNDMRQAYDMVEWLSQQSQGQTHGVSTDNETIPIFKSTHGFSTTDQNDDLLDVAAYHLGDKVHVGGGYDQHLDWAWDDSADACRTGASTQTWTTAQHPHRRMTTTV